VSITLQVARQEDACEDVAPPLAPPEGMLTTAHFQVIQEARARTPSRVTSGAKRIRLCRGRGRWNVGGTRQRSSDVLVVSDSRGRLFQLEAGAMRYAALAGAVVLHSGDRDIVPIRNISVAMREERPSSSWTGMWTAISLAEVRRTLRRPSSRLRQ
jgi:hypothetical protein